jgi:glycosyltransferase involved in cell wall biosynthesis
VKIAVDARMIKMSGIGTYIQNLMKNNCYNIALGNKEDIEQFDKNIDVIEFNSPIYGIKEQLKFPYKKLRKEKPDVLHVPHYNVPIFYRGKMVVTIHDLTHLVLPEFLPNKFAYLYAKFMIWLALKKATKVITVSENTKKDILNMFKVNPDKIEVIYNGVGEEFVKKDKKEIEYLYDKFSIPRNKKIIMYVGNLKPHKNLERLLEAYSKINEKEKTCLMLVGKAFSNYNTLGQKEQDLNIQNQVIHTGIVIQEELVDLYNLADLFVFPSLYEGFGIPILEALACGTPVICSNNSSIPEVGGNLVTYINPLDVNELSKSIENELKKEIKNIDATEWLKQFDWKVISQKVQRILKIN